MIVHQIRTGDMSDEDIASAKDIEIRCTAQGAAYHLWDTDSLIDLLPEGQLKEALDEARKQLTQQEYEEVVTCFFKFYLLRVPGVFLCAGAQCTRPGTELPNLTKYGLAVCPGAANPSSPCLDVVVSNSLSGCTGCCMLARMLEHDIVDMFFGDSMTHMRTRLRTLRSRAEWVGQVFGAQWFVIKALPALGSHGIVCTRLPLAVASCTSPRSELLCRRTQPATENNKAMYKTYQIWIGDSMPPSDAAWTARIREACFWDGIDYEMYDAEKCRTEQFSKIEAALNECDFLTQVQRNVILSDYARFEIFCTTYGSLLYLDTDFELTGDHMPVVTKDGVWGMSESWDRNLACSGVLYKGEGKLGELEAALRKQVDVVLMYLDACKTGVLSWNHKQIMSLFGPAWYRTAIAETGTKVGFLPESEFGHTRWGTPATLLHVGRGVWMDGKKDA